MTANETSERFKNELLSLFQILREIIENANSNGIETNLSPLKISFGSNLLSMIDSEDIIRQYIDRSNKDWNQIKERNIQLVKEKLPSFFSDTLKSYVEEVVQFIGNEKIVTPAILDKLWCGIRDLTVIAIKHIHHKRGMKLDESGKQIGYANNYFPDISVRISREMFEIKDWN